jgi:hypothetical protein
MMIGGDDGKSAHAVMKSGDRHFPWQMTLICDVQDTRDALRVALLNGVQFTPAAHHVMTVRANLPRT